jgi:hypothetical protein
MLLLLISPSLSPGHLASADQSQDITAFCEGHDQVAAVPSLTEDQQTPFEPRMVRIRRSRRQLISEDLSSLRERHTVLREVPPSLRFVPFELHSSKGYLTSQRSAALKAAALGSRSDAAFMSEG